jgi:hypothetical protein
VNPRRKALDQKRNYLGYLAVSIPVEGRAVQKKARNTALEVGVKFKC